MKPNDCPSQKISIQFKIIEIKIFSFFPMLSFYSMNNDILFAAISTIANIIGMFGSIQYAKRSKIIKPINQQDSAAQFLALSYFIHITQIFIIGMSLVYSAFRLIIGYRNSLSTFTYVMAAENIEFFIVNIISLGMLLYAQRNIQIEQLGEENSLEPAENSETKESISDIIVSNTKSIVITLSLMFSLFVSEAGYFLILHFH